MISPFPARKRWGQNFLVDPETARRIVEAAAIGPDETVVEIGPGDGALTRLLVRLAPGRTVAVEIDPLRAQALRDELGGDGGARIVLGDALEKTVAERVAEAGLPLPAVLVANLPYNVATPILTRAIREKGSISRIVATVQREVARRFVAAPGSEDYGFLSVHAALFSEGEILFHIPPGAFRPRPKVVSSVLRLVPIEPPARGEMLDRVLAVASASFQMRRKNLPNALSAIGSREAWGAALAACGFPPSARAEELTAGDFVRLAREERRLAAGGAA